MHGEYDHAGIEVLYRVIERQVLVAGEELVGEALA